MNRARVRSLLAAGAVAYLALGARTAAAQDLRPEAVQDLKAASSVPSVGGELALGYDGTRFG